MTGVSERVAFRGRCSRRAGESSTKIRRARSGRHLETDRSTGAMRAIEPKSSATRTVRRRETGDARGLGNEVAVPSAGALQNERVAMR